ncbi:protein GDAP2 homolog isoform X1 [Artemia franciscana]|uniref:protein GDAP2 homolog isoform X1 n=1 Tax=Artemia franciscana TaxID=6661 RepID=UPI0032DA7AFA
MDSFGKGIEETQSEKDFIDIKTLPLWSNSLAKWECEIDKTKKTSLYTIRPDLNEKIAIWTGDITLLNANAIVNIIGNMENNRLLNLMLKGADASTVNAVMSKIKACRPGEAVISSGCSLPCRYVIHVEVNAYDNRYKSAAESTLRATYTNVFDLMLQNNISTLAMVPLFSSENDFSVAQGCNITMQCIRKLLEFEGERIKTIVLVVAPSELSTYETLLPLYFPRNAAEEYYSAEQQKPGRISSGKIIRITDNPQDSYNHDSIADEENNYNTSISVGQHSFSQMNEDFDRQCLLNPEQRIIPVELTAELQHKERYERLLRQSKLEDLSEIQGIGSLYQSGYDKCGRPVILCIGKWMNYEELDLEKTLLYLINLLEPIVQGDYVVVYFHSQTGMNNHPPMNWIKDVYNTLQYRHKKNLKSFYIVHPTFWTRVMTWWFLTFMAPAIKQKVVPVYGLEYLHEFIDPDELVIPTFITEHDIRTNGIHYHQKS